MNKEILVVGHKNPDTDSVNSAYCYAALKNQLDPANRYVAGRCGNLNKQTKFIFDKVGAPAPNFFRSVYPTVADAMTDEVTSFPEEAPLCDVLKSFENLKIKGAPIVTKEGRFAGMVSMTEVSHFLLNGSTTSLPENLIRPENFDRVLEGYFFKKGQAEEFDARIVVGAMAYERFCDNLEQQNPEKLVLVVGRRENIIRQAMAKGIPAIILTGVGKDEEIEIDFSGYEGWVYISEHDSAETMRRSFLGTPAKFIMNDQAPTLNPGQYLEEAKAALQDSPYKGLAVTKENGELVGFLSRNDILNQEPKRVILMDHNEMSQAIDGADSAEIMEIIDHHRLGTIKTKKPVHFFAKPVGSTCTLVYQQYLINGVEMNDEVAKLLLSGMLTDTVILKSPTTTEEDKKAVLALSEKLGMDYQEWGIEIFSATDSMKTRSAADIINTDFKAFEEAGVLFGIGQVEVVTLDELPEKEEEIFQGLAEIRDEKGLSWTMLLVTDIIKEDSILLCTPFEAGERTLQYKQLAPQRFSLPGVLSRKKQLLPEILRVLEELGK